MLYKGQRVKSTKTRIKTKYFFQNKILLDCQRVKSTKTRIKTLVGLTVPSDNWNGQRVKSTKTRIKTLRNRTPKPSQTWCQRVKSTKTRIKTNNEPVSPQSCEESESKVH